MSDPSFRQLAVWNKAIELTILVYEFTTDFPKQEIYGLTSQMGRASVSIASNLAEGSARGTRRDFRQFVRLARGSSCKLQTQIKIVRRLSLGDQTKCDQVDLPAQEIGRMLSGLIQYLTDKIKSEQPKPIAISLTTNH